MTTPALRHEMPIFFDIFSDGSIIISRGQGIFIDEITLKDLSGLKDFIKVAQMFADQCDKLLNEGEEWPDYVRRIES